MPQARTHIQFQLRFSNQGEFHQMVSFVSQWPRLQVVVHQRIQLPEHIIDIEHHLQSRNGHQNRPKHNFSNNNIKFDRRHIHKRNLPTKANCVYDLHVVQQFFRLQFDFEQYLSGISRVGLCSASCQVQ